MSTHRSGPFVFFCAIALAALFGARQAVAQTTPPPAPDPSDAFFDDTVVHEIRLAINSRDWVTLKSNYLANDYYPCDLKWGTQTVRNVGIRSRGNGSRSGVKPGLRVDFDRYTSSQKFLGLKSFVLRNNTQDQTNMHERVAMLFFKRQGMLASREAHARLYINNAYSGLYTIVEAVDKLFLEKNLGEDSGTLYKYDYPPTDQPYYLEYKGPDSALYVPLPFKPETNETDPQPAPLVDMIRTIAETSGALFRQQMAQFLDLSKFVKHVAVEVFLADSDGFLGDWGMNNFYLYRPTDRNLFTILPWDKSEAFKDGPTYEIFRNIDDVAEANRNRLMTRVLADPELKNLFLDTLLELARSASEPLVVAPEMTPTDTRGWLERETEREYSQVRDAVLADPEKAYTNDEFEAAVEAMRVFARQRGDFVKAAVARARP
ncbi:MAG: hypothetical protein A3H97_01350 [Acidobacteria bacterium RIFCSPLOWO2_02_FULL_65_29]|nr:MAG: hypothetical protein A3H97_01350 [Acidobacteria bacterium RIFCSPLOWO2_02_FULL_65_29]